MKWARADNQDLPDQHWFYAFPERKRQPLGEYEVTVKPSPFADGIPLPKVSLPKVYTETNQAVLVMKVEPGRNEIDLAIDTTK